MCKTVQCEQVEPIVIEFRGPIPGKKNRKSPNKGGRGLHIDPQVQQMISRLELQVPGHVRDLFLEHPEVEFQFFYEKANWDLDNAETTIIDILQKYGVIRNDNIKRFNGKKTTWPAIHTDYPGCTVTLIPSDLPADDAMSRYKPRQRHHAIFRPSLATVQPSNSGTAVLEDYHDDEEEY